jgi:hypothetical protein
MYVAWRHVVFVRLRARLVLLAGDARLVEAASSRIMIVSAFFILVF